MACLPAALALLAWAPPPGAESVGPQPANVDLSHYARVVYVSAGRGSETGDGSRTRPWRSIERALGVASSGRTAVLVAEGRYSGATIRLKQGLDLYGGFEDRGWARDVLRRFTVLDGGGERRVVEGADDSRLDGFVIRNGRVRGKGAGLLCEGVSPVIVNNIFTGNETLAAANWKPAILHETANDGGAIALLNRSRAVVEHNLVARNTTECGRGAGIAVDGQSAPRIAFNVVLENRSGTLDPGRSSDGGGISIYDRSHAEIVGNVIAGNRSAASNDAGGIFVALWSSPFIAQNIIAGNWGADDGGALFVGGQKHHYGTPLEPVPGEREFLVRVYGNLIAGNDNSAHNAGIARVTMQARAEFRDNIMAWNSGGLRIQSSGAAIVANAIGDPVAAMNDSKGSRDLPGPVSFEKNLLGGKTDFEMPVRSEGNCTAASRTFAADFLGKIVALEPSPDSFGTRIRTAAPVAATPGAVIRAGRVWTVVRSAQAGKLEVWGTLHESPVDFEVFSFRKLPSCGGSK